MGLHVKYLLILPFALALWSCSGNPDGPESIRFYVGSSGPQEHSIFLCELDTDALSFTVLDSFSGAPGASYLAPSPGLKSLYAINREISDPDLKHSTVSAFRVDRETLGLELIFTSFKRKKQTLMDSFSIQMLLF